MARTVEIKLIVDANGAVKGIRDATGGMLRLEKQTDQAGEKVTRFGRVMDVTFGNLAASAVQQLTRQLASLVRSGFRLLGDAVQGAGIQQIAERKLEQALLNLGDASEASRKHIKLAAAEVQRFSNFGDEASITAAAMLASFKQVGSAEGIGLLLPRLADMAAGVAKVTGETVDLNQVAIAVGKALEGGASSLKRYGVSLTEAQAKAIDAATGMDKVRLLTEVLDGNFKGLAEATRDPWRQLQNSTGDLVEQLGFGQNNDGLLAVSQMVADELRALAENEDVIAFVRRLGTQIADAIEFAIQAVKEAIRIWQEHGDQIVLAAKLIGILALAVKTYAAAQVLANTQIAIATALTRGYALATALATNAVGALRRGIHLLTVAIRANPIGLLVTAVTTAAAAFLLFRNRSDEATEALKRQREEAARTRDEIEKLTGVMAASRLIELQADVQVNTSELERVQEQIAQLEREGKDVEVRTVFTGGGIVQLRQASAEIVALREREAALQATIAEQRLAEAAVEGQVAKSLSAQLEVLEHQIRQEKDKATLTKEEQARLEELRRQRAALADDADLADAEQKQRKEELLALETEILEASKARLPQERIEDLERQAQLIRDQIEARRELEEDETTTGGLTPDQQKAIREKEFEKRALEIELMEESKAKKLALIDLEIDQQKARYIEKFPDLKADLEKHFDELRIRLKARLEIEDFKQNAELENQIREQQQRLRDIEFDAFVSTIEDPQARRMAAIQAEYATRINAAQDAYEHERALIEKTVQDEEEKALRIRAIDARLQADLAEAEREHSEATREAALKSIETIEGVAQRIGLLQEQLLRTPGEAARSAIRQQIRDLEELKHLMEGGFDTKSAQEALEKGLLSSIAKVDQALSDLQFDLENATTKEARAEVQALIDKLEALRGRLQDARTDFGALLEGSLEQALEDFGAGLGAVATGTDRISESIRQVDDNLGQLGKRASEVDAELLKLQQRLDSASTEQQRQEIQAQIEALQAQRTAIQASIAEQDQLKDKLESTHKAIAAATDAVLGTVADLAIKVGKIAIATGIGIEGIKKALQTLNPFVAIAAGVALIALGAAVKAALARAAQGPGSVDVPRAGGTGTQASGSGRSERSAGVQVGLPGFADGVTDAEGGLAIVGEKGPELVNLPRGSNVITNENTQGLLAALGQRSDSQLVVQAIERLTRTLSAHLEKVLLELRSMKAYRIETTSAEMGLTGPRVSHTKGTFVSAVPGKADGGKIEGGEQIIRVNEEGPEYVVPAEPTRRYFPILEAMRAGKDPREVLRRLAAMPEADVEPYRSGGLVGERSGHGPADRLASTPPRRGGPPGTKGFPMPASAMPSAGGRFSNADVVEAIGALGRRIDAMQGRIDIVVEQVDWMTVNANVRRAEQKTRGLLGE